MHGNRSGWQRQSMPLAYQPVTSSPAESVQGTADVSAVQPHQSVHSVPWNSYNNPYLEYQVTDVRGPATNNHALATREDASQPDTESATGWPTNRDSDGYSYYSSTHSVSLNPYDNTTHGITQYQGRRPPTNDNAQAHHDDPHFLHPGITQQNSQSNSAWPATQNAHLINVQRHFPDHSSAHFVPGNPHNTTINATQYQATYGGNPTSNYHAQAPRRDNPLAIDHGIQSATGWPTQNSPFSGFHHGSPDYSPAHPVLGNSYSSTRSNVTQQQVMYRERIMTNNYMQAPLDDMSDEDPYAGDALGSLSPIDRRITPHDIQSGVAEWPPDEASSTNRHHYSSANCMSGNPQDDATPGGAEFPTTIDPVHLTNDHVSASNVGDRSILCGWDVGSGLCGKPVEARRDRVTKHMKSYHCTSRLAPDSLLQCRWKDCTYKEKIRRDTFFRHVARRHFGIRIPGSKAGEDSAMSP